MPVPKLAHQCEFSSDCKQEFSARRMIDYFSRFSRGRDIQKHPAFVRTDAVQPYGKNRIMTERSADGMSHVSDYTG